MSQRDERSQIKRRSRISTGDPDPLIYPAPTGKTGPSLNTGGYEEDEGVAEPRQNTSVIRLDHPSSMQTSRITNSSTQGIPVPSRRQSGGTREFPRTSQRNPTQPQSPNNQTKHHSNVHWLLPLGLGMVAMLVLWVLGSSILAWGIQRYNDIHYGYPRTFQIDAVVGHNDSRTKPSHFIAINLNRQAVVTEYMGGDPTKEVSYIAPVYIAGQNGDLAPITLEFRDVNGDGKPDMIIHIHLPDQDQVSVFINDGTKFRPSNGTDKIRL